MKPRGAVVLARDLLVRARLERAATDAGYQLVGDAGEVDLVLADLDEAGLLEQLIGRRAARPQLRVVAFVSHVDRKTWERAEAAGIEVHPRGASRRGAELLGA